MANKTNTVDEAKPSFGARFKERMRKKTVSLKRKPQKIAMLFLAISTLIYLLSLNTLSPGPVKDLGTQNLGLLIFINTLFSILVLVLFLNTFPKHGFQFKKTGKKYKVNFIMLVLTFIFLIVMIVVDVLYVNKVYGAIAGNESMFFSSAEEALSPRFAKYISESFDASKLNTENYKPYLLKSVTLSYVHLGFVAFSGFLLATLPIYSKLINKINTKKDLAATQLTEKIDTED